jgi:hypothetical protein
LLLFNNISNRFSADINRFDNYTEFGFFNQLGTSCSSFCFGFFWWCVAAGAGGACGAPAATWFCWLLVGEDPQLGKAMVEDKVKNATIAKRVALLFAAIGLNLICDRELVLMRVFMAASPIRCLVLNVMVVLV